jgi:hypothetical protein
MMSLLTGPFLAMNNEQEDEVNGQEDEVTGQQGIRRHLCLNVLFIVKVPSSETCYIFGLRGAKLASLKSPPRLRPLKLPRLREVVFWTKFSGIRICRK